MEKFSAVSQANFSPGSQVSTYPAPPLFPQDITQESQFLIANFTYQDVTRLDRLPIRKGDQRAISLATITFSTLSYEL